MPRYHFDPVPQGDVEIWVECPGGYAFPGRATDVRTEKKQEYRPIGSTPVLPSFPAHTGPELDGVIVGFVHDPASIIETREAARPVIG